MKNIAKIRQFTIGALIPFYILIILFTSIYHLGYVQYMKDSGGLKINYFLHKPVLSILKNEEDAVIPNYIYMVLMENGTSLYQSNEGIIILDHIQDYNSDRDNKEINVNLFQIINFFAKNLETFSVKPFSYKGQYGVVIYSIDKSIYPDKIIRNPRVPYLFLIMSIFLFLTLSLLYKSFFWNIKKLTTASKRLLNMDWDSEITYNKPNELCMIYDALEKLRKGLNHLKKRGSIALLSIAHDLNTPITSIRAYLEAINDGVISDEKEVRDAIKIVLNKTTILEERVQQVLEFTKMQVQDFNMMKHSFNAREWLNNCNKDLIEEGKINKRLFSANIKIPSGIRIKTHEHLMTRALHNLWDNAYRFTTPGDKIELISTYNTESKEITIILDDSGSGVNDDMKEEIFELFYKVEKGRNSRGMGIGLAAVHSLIEGMRGSIYCEDSPLGGARFKIVLPVDEF